jgi:hypothetical protein
VVGFLWPNEPESYAGGNLATGMVSYDRQVEGYNPDQKGPVLPGWRLGPYGNKIIFVQKFVFEKSHNLCL